MHSRLKLRRNRADESMRRRHNWYNHSLSLSLPLSGKTHKLSKHTHIGYRETATHKQLISVNAARHQSKPAMNTHPCVHVVWDCEAEKKEKKHLFYRFYRHPELAWRWSEALSTKRVLRETCQEVWPPTGVSSDVWHLWNILPSSFLRSSSQLDPTSIRSRICCSWQHGLAHRLSEGASWPSQYGYHGAAKTTWDRPWTTCSAGWSHTLQRRGMAGIPCRSTWYPTWSALDLRMSAESQHTNGRRMSTAEQKARLSPHTWRSTTVRSWWPLPFHSVKQKDSQLYQTRAARCRICWRPVFA